MFIKGICQCGLLHFEFFKRAVRLQTQKFFFAYCYNKREETSIMALNIDPPDVTFPAAGGNATVNIINQTESRLGFKVCN